MRLLDRYLFRELLAPLFYCLGGFLIFWISFQLFDKLGDLQSAKLHLVDVLELCVAWAPACLATTLPMALLLALLYALTDHARHNEITAMRATGMSLWRICLPYFGVGLFASVALFALNELAVPRSAAWSDRILQRYLSRQPGSGQQPGFRNDRANRTWVFTNFNYKAGELDGVRVETNGWYLTASKALWTNRVWTFYNVNEWTKDGPQMDRTLAPVLAMPQFDETPGDIRLELKITDYEGAARRNSEVPLADLLTYLWLRPEARSGWLWTQLHERLAAPWTCLVVVLIAIPFGAASGRRNLFFGVAGSIFIFFAYYFLQQFSLAFGIGGHCPGWLAAWLPNLVFAATGLVLIERAR